MAEKAKTTKVVVPCDDDDDGYLINLFNEKSL
jgi:hypothetical protein